MDHTNIVNFEGQARNVNFRLEKGHIDMKGWTQASLAHLFCGDLVDSQCYRQAGSVYVASVLTPSGELWLDQI